MAGIVITLHVDAAAAVRAGSGVCGRVQLRLTPAQIDELTERQRDALARHVAGEPGWSKPLSLDAPPIGRADLATLAALLEHRANVLAFVVKPWQTLSYRCRECGAYVEGHCAEHPSAIVDSCIEPKEGNDDR